jgi:hypothetical protein
MQNPYHFAPATIAPAPATIARGLRNTAQTILGVSSHTNEPTWLEDLQQAAKMPITGGIEWRSFVSWQLVGGAVSRRRFQEYQRTVIRDKVLLKESFGRSEPLLK